MGKKMWYKYIVFEIVFSKPVERWGRKASVSKRKRTIDRLQHFVAAGFSFEGEKTVESGIS